MPVVMWPALEMCVVVGPVLRPVLRLLQGNQNPAESPPPGGIEESPRIDVRKDEIGVQLRPTPAEGRGKQETQG